jgi:hypothetical protein
VAERSWRFESSPGHQVFHAQLMRAVTIGSGWAPRAHVTIFGGIPAKAAWLGCFLALMPINDAAEKWGEGCFTKRHERDTLWPDPH